MKMRFKRASAAILAAALAVPAMSITAFAEEDAAMKKELTYVKQRIDIPEQCTEFNYSTRTENNSKRYTFNWTLPDDTDYSTLPTTGVESVTSVRVEITGKVIKSVYFNHYSSDWNASFAKLTNAQILSKAKALMKEINPTINSSTVLNEDPVSLNLYGDAVYVGFHREVSGIPVTGQTGSIAINKNTGELISYNYNWTNGASFSNSDKAISESAAQEAYKSLFGSEINYTLYYDWEKKEYVPHLIYTQSDYGQINAFTGKLSTFEDYDSYERGDDDAEVAYDEEAPAMATADMAGNGSSKAVTFSDNEIKKLEDESKLIKAQDAIKALSKYDFFFIPETAEVTWDNCSYNQRDGYYVRNVSFTAKADEFIDLSDEKFKALIASGVYDSDDYVISGSFAINAETGDLLSYNCYMNDYDRNLTDAKAQKIAGEALKVLLGDACSEFEAIEESGRSEHYKEYDPNTGLGVGSPITTSISYKANREAYGIKCANEYTNLTVSSTGYVTSYRLTYHPEVEYPDAAGRISADEAYNIFFKDANLSLKYRVAYRTKDKKIVSALVYAADRTMYVDALAGTNVNYDGSELTDRKSNEYTDLENSKYKKYAEKLAEYDIVLMDEEGRLNENDTATAEDLLNLMSNVGMGYANINEMGIKAETKLNRQTAAKLAVTARFGKEVAELTDAFNAKFSDVSGKMVGYAAIADAAGWIKGGSDGKFNPRGAFTRGEAIKLVYTYLAKS